ncbi:ATP-binding cassette domain-containing protein [Massilibacteroides vaginae]|uniref:ATP-binding cassette domain-containing protein n=1 Tax=Massilibacteroides vaginae TaxID=1673718 RepID=UPI000A1C83E7|nr:ATP-binding cassette domain-containing protein [Massilibacteroides vaginae]
MSIVANALSYIHPNGEVLFNQINFSISSGDKVSLVGNNGVGKSTLLRIISGIQIHTPDIVLLDEPSNHLDAQSRSALYKFIEEAKHTILLVSHDRSLLDKVKTTMELTPNSVEIYGGNYAFYRRQKELKINSLHSLLADKEKNLKQTQQKFRDMAEQRQKLESRGHAQKAKAGTPRIAMGKLKDKAEQSSAKIKNEQTEKANDISTEIKTIKQTIQEEQLLKIEIKDSGLYTGKVLVEAADVNIIYGEHSLWKEAVSFHIYSGDRIQITGNNGAGKTSLIRLITKETPASTGRLFIADFKYLHVDQEYSIIDNRLTVFEQAQKFNDQHFPEHEVKMLLHRHQFSKNYWTRPCASLSGGEKMKLLLCSLSISNNTPDILILDEPTNNLDIRSKDILTYATKEFKGTIIVISHDAHFSKEIGINKYISI